MSRIHRFGLMGSVSFALGFMVCAEVRTVFERSADGSEFAFQTVPRPARDDAAATAEFRLLDGEPDSNGGTLAILHDGRLPTEEDQPRANFFFRAGTAGGRIRLDLVGIRTVKQVNTYSWHANTRGPQVYQLYGADGQAAGFQHTPAPTPAVGGTPERIVRTFEAGGDRYRFTLDATVAPDLLAWTETKLQPVVQEWYPKLVEMLPSPGFEAATNLTLRFRDDMGGTPASAGGSRVNLNSAWFRKELQREALGAVVHELVHVVQDYGRARRTNAAATRTPGWLVEGIADYIRWFLYEPETRGAEITARNLERARYDASYRITGNFLNWVTQAYDPQLVRKLNAAAREGRYTESLWRDWTGKTLPELGTEWREANVARIHAGDAK